MKVGTNNPEQATTFYPFKGVFTDQVIIITILPRILTIKYHNKPFKSMSKKRRLKDRFSDVSTAFTFCFSYFPTMDVHTYWTVHPLLLETYCKMMLKTN